MTVTATDTYHLTSPHKRKGEADPGGMTVSIPGFGGSPLMLYSIASRAKNLVKNLF